MVKITFGLLKLHQDSFQDIAYTLLSMFSGTYFYSYHCFSFKTLNCLKTETSAIKDKLWPTSFHGDFLVFLEALKEYEQLFHLITVSNLKIKLTNT